MAVTPVIERRSNDVMQELTRLRNGIDQLVASVREGRVTLSEVFARAEGGAVVYSQESVSDDARVCAFVYLVKIAEALPGVGKVRARRILEEHGLGERTRVGAVSPAVRTSLVEALT